MRGAGTILYVGGQPIKINVVVKVGGTYTKEVPLDFKVGGHIPPSPHVAAPLPVRHNYKEEQILYLHKTYTHTLYTLYTFV